MTKYYQDRHKFDRNNGDTPISIRDYQNTYEDRTLICSFCNRDMIKLQDRNSTSISYFCRACNTETSTEETDNIRTRSRLQMPDGVNTNPYTSTQFPDYSVGKTPPPIRGSFKTLQDRGMRIRNYKDEVKG